MKTIMKENQEDLTIGFEKANQMVKSFKQKLCTVNKIAIIMKEVE